MSENEKRAKTGRGRETACVREEGKEGGERAERERKRS